jgi:hypothetical protein
MACSESTSVRASTAMSPNGIIPPTVTVRTFVSVPEYGIRDYRYTIVNDRTVLVDPRTHRIVEVIE